MSSRAIALIAIVGASLFWASAGVVAKLLLQSIPPFPLAFIRFTLAALIILPFFIKFNKVPLPILIREVAPITLLGGVNVALFYLGLTKTTNNASAIIYGAVPIVTAIAAYITLKEKLNLRKIFGIIVGFIGVVTIIVLPLIETGKNLSGDFGGNLIIMIAVFAWSGYTIGSRHLIVHKRYSPLALTSVSLFTSAVFFGILTHIFFPADYISPLLNPVNFLLVLHLACIVTVGAFLLFQWAIKHTSAATATLTNYLQPVFAVTLGVIILSEPVTIAFIFGSLLILVGVTLASGEQTLRLIISLGRYFKNRSRN